MSGDWQPGDLALCIHDRHWHPIGRGARAEPQVSKAVVMLFPRVGSKWRVTDVRLYESPEEGVELIYLGLAGQPSDAWYDARCFTKLGEHQADEEDRETIRLIKHAHVTEPAA